MSGFILSRTAARVEIVSDGGSYDRDGNLVHVYNKARIALSGLPLAVVMRGASADFCNLVADAIFDLATESGQVDHALAGLQSTFTAMADWLADKPVAEFTIAAISESRGAVDLMGQTKPWTVDGHPVAVGQFQDLAPLFVASLAIVTAAELQAVGFTLPPDAAPPDMLEQHGIAAMELIRCKPMSADEWQQRYGIHRATYAIGGHVQYVSVTPQGASSRIVKTWPDEIGKPITPTCEAVP